MKNTVLDYVDKLPISVNVVIDTPDIAIIVSSGESIDDRYIKIRNYYGNTSREIYCAQVAFDIFKACIKAGGVDSKVLEDYFVNKCCTK